MKGVLDRFEENQAVILLEDQKEEIIVERDALPENSQINTWFNIEKTGGQYKLSIDHDTTEKELETSQDLLAKLRAKKKGSKFKTN
ncbi:hypothetical protein JNUCC1_02799 [Lentibacillus sp. JNUCC-1]|uniref:DUF3006 domain-containing protein n=1 Tax=Lentibacillus sp. JNUCC-1 TaxID=2654513 RepID=UPI00132C8DA6|nr:DUF3006 domain-containing protein [Lentibacillus sp. JNUCC-1]MUV38927.1 hypothetical protein [Lentibacillus sp. JNUCC-1]